MKLLADENIGFRVIMPLRKQGFIIKSVLEINPGIDDIEVLSLANKENRIIITTDKDFGELVYAKKLIHTGIIFLRLRKDSSENKLKVLQNLFETHLEELQNCFTVVQEGRVRISK